MSWNDELAGETAFDPMRCDLSHNHAAAPRPISTSPASAHAGTDAAAGICAGLGATTGARHRHYAHSTSSTRFLLSSDNGGYDRAIGIRSAGVNSVGWSAYAGTADTAAGKAGAKAHTLPVTIGQWSFVAAVYDQQAGTVTTYVDGAVAVREMAELGSGRPSLRIGGNGGTAGTGLHAIIDNVFVYDTALSVAELDYLRTAVPAPPAPVAGSSGYALSLHGVNSPAVSGAASEDGQKQYMSVPHHDSISGMTSLTLALWLNPAEVVEMEATLLEKASAYRLSLMPASNDGADMRVRVRLDDDFDWTVDVPLLGE